MNNRTKAMMDHVIEAIAYMECLPSNHTNVKIRRNMRDVTQYLNALNKSEALAEGAANHD